MRKILNNFYKALKAWIPQHIKNKDVLAFYEILRHFSNISEKRIEKNAKINEGLLYNSKSILKSGDYIENQGEWEVVQFGSLKEHNMKYSGCEIIATYNALMALGEAVSGEMMVNLISGYERDGAALNGDFGVSPVAIEDYFKNRGYDVSITTSKEIDTINNIGVKSDTVIVTAYNDQHDITAQVHTVSITKEADGKYCIHNSYYYDKHNGTYVSRRGFDTLQNAINGMSSDASVISVIGISKPK